MWCGFGEVRVEARKEGKKGRDELEKMWRGSQ